MIQDQQGAQVPVPGQPPGLLALPPAPVPGGGNGQAQGSFGPVPDAKRNKRLGRSLSFSPSTYGRAKALADEKSSIGPALFLQDATKGPTGGATSSFGPMPPGSNPTVGFAVTKEFTEVRVDLLEAQQKLNEYETQIRDEATQLRQTSLAQQQSEQEIAQLRAQLGQRAELAGVQLEHQHTVNTAEHHVLQQASALAKVEFRSAVAEEQGRFEQRQAIARHEVQNEVGQAQDALLHREAALGEQYANAERTLGEKVNAMEARMNQEQAQAMADIDRQAKIWKEQVQRDVDSQQVRAVDSHTLGLRQQLAEAQEKARLFEQSETSMAKHQGETERMLNMERTRTAQLKEQMQRTAETNSSGSWSEVGSQRPQTQPQFQGPSPPVGEAQGARAEGEEHHASSQEQQGPECQRVFPESAEEDERSTYSYSPGRHERDSDMMELVGLLARNQIESNSKHSALLLSLKEAQTETNRPKTKAENPTLQPLTVRS